MCKLRADDLYPAPSLVGGDSVLLVSGSFTGQVYYMPSMSILKCKLCEYFTFFMWITHYLYTTSTYSSSKEIHLFSFFVPDFFVDVLTT